MTAVSFEVGDVVDVVYSTEGWEDGRHTITIEEVHLNYGGRGNHRYYGVDKRRQPHGFYHDQIVRMR